MKYLLATATDTGIGKETNQDAILLKRALWGEEQIAFAVMCDGMGGLEKGEVASASLIKAFGKWFDEELPEILSSQMVETRLLTSWNKLIKEMNYKIGVYGLEHKIRLGTTCTAMFFLTEDYYIAHIGDSRAYEVKKRIIQLTKDQTLVQREVDWGLLTPKEAENDLRRSVLLQCVGASEFIEPVYLKGKIAKDAVYILCCDGFRHVISDAEIYKSLLPERMTDEKVMENKIYELIRVIKERGEQDNISAITIRTW